MKSWAKGYVLLKFDIDKLLPKEAMSIYSPINSKHIRVPFYIFASLRLRVVLIQISLITSKAEGLFIHL